MMSKIQKKKVKKQASLVLRNWFFLSSAKKLF